MSSALQDREVGGAGRGRGSISSLAEMAQRASQIDNRRKSAVAQRLSDEADSNMTPKDGNSEQSDDDDDEDVDDLFDRLASGDLTDGQFDDLTDGQYR